MARRQGARLAGTIAVASRLDRGRLLRSTALQAVVGLAFVQSPPASAQPAPSARPQGGQVVAGSASIAATSTTTTISQSSNRAAIDWRSFNVGRDQSVVFQQPNSSAITLNRVTGGDPSAIAGRISANGQLVLTNPSGVVFSQGSQVNAQSLIVSTAGISNQNFMAGRMAFDQPGHPDARIENQGTITVKQAGLAALVAPSVANSGVINARLGTVVLAGAATHTLDMYGDGLVSIDVTGQVRQGPRGADGKPVTALVTNTGVIAADGGVVQLTAKAADGVVQTLVRAGGRIQANTVQGQTGRIEIAGTGGSVVIEGRVSADGRAPGTVGGSVAVAGSDATVVAGGARILARGSAGGGTVAVGTTLARARGTGPAVAGTSARTAVAAGARISADATGQGNGGRVTVLSTASTVMDGTATARGGKQGGDGGTIELSGESGFRLTGTADTSAPKGRLGTIVLDPRDLVISSDPNGTTNLTPANGVDPNIGAGLGGTATDAYVTPAQVQALVGNVHLQATRDLTVASSVEGQTSQTLTLEAGRNLTINSGVSVQVSTSPSGPGVLTLIAGSSAIPGYDPAGALNIQGTASSFNLTLSAGTGGIQIGGFAGGVYKGFLSRITIQTTGPVTQTAGATVLADTMSGTAASVALGSAANTINSIGATSGALTATAGDVLVASSVPLTIGGAGGIVVPSGRRIGIQADTLTLQSGGGAYALSAPGGTVTLQPLTAGRGILVTSGTKPGTALEITTAEAGTIQATTLGLNGNGASNITFGQSGDGAVDLVANGNFGLVAVSTLGNVTQNAPLTVNALGGSAGSVTLTDSSNSIPQLRGMTTSGNLNVTTSGDLAVSGAVSGDLVALSAAGALTVPAGASVTSDNLSLSSGSAEGPGGLVLAGTVTSPVQLTLNAGSNGIALSGTISADSQLLVRTPGPLTQTGGAVTTGELTGSAGSVSLPSRLNAVSQLGASSTFAVTDPGGDFLLVTSQPLQVGAPSASGGLSLQSGRTATLVTDSLSIVAGGEGSGIYVPNGTFVIASFTQGGGITLTSESKPAIGLSLTTDELSRITASTLQLGTLNGTVPTAGTITLGTGGGTVDLGSAGFTTLSLVAGGAVTQGGPIGVNTLSGQAASLSLNDVNNYVPEFAGFTTSTGGISLHTSSGLTVTGPLIAAGGAGNVTLSSVSPVGDGGSTSMQLSSDIVGNVVSLNSLSGTPSLSGGIVQDAGTITANSLTAATGFLTLPQQNRIVALADVQSAGTVSVTNALPLQLTGAINTSFSTLELNAAGITQTPTASITTYGLQGSSSANTVLTSRNNSIQAVGGFTQSAGDFTLVTSAPTLAFGYNNAPVTAASGSLTFIADSMFGNPSVSGGVALSAPNGRVTLAPFTANRRIELIGITAGDGKSLSIGQQLASEITARRLALGNADSTGAINLANANETVDLTGRVTTLQLQTTGSVTEGVSPSGQNGSGTLALKVSNLTGRVGSLVAGAAGNAIASLGLADGTAGSIDGLAAAQSLTVQSASSLTVNNGVSADLSTGTLTIGSAVALQTTGTLLGGTVTLVSAGGTLLQSAGLIVASGTLTLSAAGQPISQTGGSITAGTLSGRGATATLGAAGNSVANLGDFTTTGLFSLSDSRALTVSGLLVAGTANLNVTGALNGLTLAARVIATNALTLSTASGAISQTGGDITTASLSGSAAGALLNSATNAVTTLAGFSTATGFSLRDSRALTVSGPLTASTGALTVAGDLTLAGTVTTGGGMVLSATGAITQTSGTLAVGTLSGNAASAALGSTANTVASLGSFVTTGAFALADGRSLTVTGPLSASTGALSVTGDLSLSGPINVTGGLSLAASGAITQPGGVITAATLSGSAASAALGSGTNNVATLAGFNTTGAFALVDGRPLTVSGPVSAGAGSLAVTGDLTLSGSVTTTGVLSLAASGAITQPGGSITAATLAGSAGSATLGSTTNSVATLGGFSTTGAFALTDARSLTVSGVSASTASLSVTGDLALAGSVTTTGALNLAVSGAITQPAGAVTAGTVAGSATSAALGSATNTVTALGAFSTTGAFALADGRSLTVAGPVSASTGALTVAGDLTLAGSVTTTGTLTLTSTGAITQPGGAITAATLSGSAASAALGNATNSVATLGAFNTTGAFAFADGRSLTVSGPVSASVGALSVTGDLALAGTVTTTGGLSLVSSGAITQPGGSITAGTLSGTAASATLGSATNGVATLGAFTTTGAFAVTDGQTLAVAGPVSAASASFQVTGDLMLAGPVSTTGPLSLAVSGAITQQSGTITAGTLTGSAGSAILTQRGNAVAGLGTFAVGGDFALADQSALTVTGVVSAGAGHTITLSVDTPSFARGAQLSAPGGTVAFSEYTAGRGITLTSSSGITDPSLVVADVLQIGSATGGPVTVAGPLNLSTVGTLDLRSGGSITETEAGSIQVARLTGQGASAALGGANAIGELAGFATTGAFALTDGTALTVSGPVSASTGALTVAGDLTLTGTVKTTGALTLTSSGTITQTDGALDVAALQGTAGSASFGSAANSVGTLGAFSTKGGFALTNGQSLTVSGPLSASTGALSVTGDLALAGSLTTTGSLSLIASGAITQPSGSITAGTLTGTAGSASLAGAANSVPTLGSFATAGAFVFVDGTGLTVTGPVSAGTASLGVTGDLGLAGSVATKGGLGLVATGAITQPGGAIAAATLTGSAGSAALGSATNSVADLGAFTATGAFALTDTRSLAVSGPVSATTAALNVTGDLSLAGAVTVTSGLSLVASGAITQPGGMIATATLTGSAGSAALGSAANSVAALGAFSTTGAFALTDGQGLAVSGPVSAASGVLNVTGDLGLAGPVATKDGLALTASGAITQTSGSITATTLSGSATSAALGSGANRVAVLGGFKTVGAFALSDSLALTVAGPLTASTASLRVTGDLALAGSLATTRGLSLTASGAITQPAGSITAATLSGSATSTALGSGSNRVDVLGGFTTTGAFALADGQALTVSGPVSASTAAVTVAGDLALAGTVTTTGGLALAVSGAVTQTSGAVVAGTLTGNAGSAALGSAANNVAALGGFGTTGGFALTDGRSLTVSGPVSASTASLVVSGDLALAGTMTAPGGLGLTVSGAITQPGGAIATGTLSGSAASANFGSAGNSVAVLRGFTTPGAFALADGRALTVSGPVSASTASLNVSGDLALAGVVTAADALGLAVSGAITQPGGGIVSGRLTGSAGSASLGAPGNRIAALGSFSTIGDFALSDQSALTVAGVVSAGTGRSITLAVDAPTFATGARLSAPGGTVAFTEYTPGRGITLSAGSAFVDPALVDAATLQIGSATAGPIMVTGALNLSTIGTLDLRSGGAITETGGGAIQVGQLTGQGTSLALGGANRIGGLAGFTATDTIAVNNLQSLAVSGAVSGSNVTLASSGDLVLTGAIATPGTLTLTAAGGISQPDGSISARALTGSASGATIDRAANQVGDLAGFTTTGDFTFTTARSLVVSAPVDPNTVTLNVAGTLTLNSSVTGGTVVLNATGGIVEGRGGLVNADTLSGSTSGAAQLGGANQIGTLSNFTSTAGLTLSDGRALSVAGTVSDGQAISLSAAGALGLVGRMETGALTLASSGPITMSGRVTAASIQVATPGSVTQQAGSLSVGSLAGTVGSLDLGRGGAAAISGIADLSATGTVTVLDQSPLRLSGAISAPYLAITSTGTLTLDGGTIRTNGVPLSGQTGSTPVAPGSTLSVLASGDGTALLQQLGTTTFAPLSGGLATVRLQLPASGGRVTLSDLQARQADVVMAVGSGSAQGPIVANNLVVIGSGGRVTLTGEVAGREGTTAAQVSKVSPRVTDLYTLNGCAIEAASCTPDASVLFVTAAIASILRPDILTLDVLDLSVIRDRDDPTLLLPNISDRDY